MGRGVEIIKPDEHWRGLAEVAGGIQYALDRLGSDEQVFFNAHRASLALPDDAIIFNAEQVPVDGDAVRVARWKPYLERLKRHTVWDYSAQNVERLRLLGVRATHCRVGWWPGLVSVPAAVTVDTDVLFIGSMNDRRAMLIYDLGKKKLKVRTLFGVYGRARDEWMARSKIILNAHFYEHPIHEIFRTSHAVANGKCVVSENDGCDPELEAFAREATVYTPYGGIVDACALLAGDEKLRAEVGKRGRQLFEGIDQVAEVKAALERA